MYLELRYLNPTFVLGTTILLFQISHYLGSEETSCFIIVFRYAYFLKHRTKMFKKYLYDFLAASRQAQGQIL